jgi:hypothetical protein
MNTAFVFGAIPEAQHSRGEERNRRALLLQIRPGVSILTMSRSVSWPHDVRVYVCPSSWAYA